MTSSVVRTRAVECEASTSGTEMNGMATVEVGERLLVDGLQRVVELFDQPFSDLGDHVVGVEPTEALLQDRAEQAGVAQVGLDRRARRPGTAP